MWHPTKMQAWGRRSLPPENSLCDPRVSRLAMETGALHVKHNILSMSPPLSTLPVPLPEPRVQPPAPRPSWPVSLSVVCPKLPSCRPNLQRQGFVKSLGVQLKMPQAPTRGSPLLCSSLSEPGHRPHGSRKCIGGEGKHPQTEKLWKLLPKCLYSPTGQTTTAK